MSDLSEADMEWARSVAERIGREPMRVSRVAHFTDDGVRVEIMLTASDLAAMEPAEVHDIYDGSPVLYRTVDPRGVAWLALWCDSDSAIDRFMFAPLVGDLYERAQAVNGPCLRDVFACNPTGAVWVATERNGEVASVEGMLCRDIDPARLPAADVWLGMPGDF